MCAGCCYLPGEPRFVVFDKPVAIVRSKPRKLIGVAQGRSETGRRENLWMNRRLYSQLEEEEDEHGARQSCSGFPRRIEGDHAMPPHASASLVAWAVTHITLLPPLPLFASVCRATLSRLSNKFLRAENYRSRCVPIQSQSSQLTTPEGKRLWNRLRTRNGRVRVAQRGDTRTKMRGTGRVWGVQGGVTEGGELRAGIVLRSELRNL